jgi:hypothetical protein
MQFTVKVIAPGFSGSAALAPPFAQPNKDGIIVVEPASAVGRIDPDFFGGPMSGKNLLLQSFFVKVANGTTGDNVTVVSDTDDVLFTLKEDFSGLGTYFSDRRWILPRGCRLRVQLNGSAGSLATLMLNLWVLDDPRQLAAAAPVSTA